MEAPAICHGIVWPRPGFVPRRRITLRGWCFDIGGREIQGVRAIVGGGRTFKAVRKQPTFQLGIDYPGCAEASYAGYKIDLELPRGRCEIEVQFRNRAGNWVEMEKFVVLAPWLFESPERCGFDYKLWLSRYDSRDGWEVESWGEVASRIVRRPLFSICVRANEGGGGHVLTEALKRTLASLRAQVYDDWECLIEDGVELPTWPNLGHRLRRGGFGAASGDFITVLDAGDRLAPHALAWVAEAADSAHEDARLIYCDEDVADLQGQRDEPWFKPDWDPEYFLSRDYISRSGFFRRSMIPADADRLPPQEQLAGLLDNSPGGSIIHIPAVLYHRGVRRPSRPRGIRRVGLLPSPLPKVEIVIPTRNRPDLMRQCVDSVLRKTDYDRDRYSIRIVDNGDDAETTEYLNEVRAQWVKSIHVMRSPGEFNFAALNNLAIEASEADIIVCLNNDVEVVTPGWLRSMVELAAQPKIGAVGARLLYPDKKIQHLGVFLGFRDYAGHLYKGCEDDSPDLMRRRDVVHQVSAVTAACLAVSREKFLSVKGFDAEAFPVSVNDVDFCLKLHNLGHRNVMCPHAQLLHLESATRGPDEVRAERKRAAKREMLNFYMRWAEHVAEDPFYNPNLAISCESVSLADPPRIALTYQTDDEATQA